MTIRKIVVGADGSPGSIRAVRWAAARAVEADAEVIIITGLDINTQLARDLPPTGLGNWRAELQRQLHNDWVQPLIDAGVTYRTAIVEAAPAVALMQIADNEDADLIVIGAQGHGGLAGRLLGSVPYRVTHLAKQPVTVVPADWQRYDE